jgi:hypothetical protein
MGSTSSYSCCCCHSSLLSMNLRICKFWLSNNLISVILQVWDISVILVLAVNNWTLEHASRRIMLRKSLWVIKLIFVSDLSIEFYSSRFPYTTEVLIAFRRSLQCAWFLISGVVVTCLTGSGTILRFIIVESGVFFIFSKSRLSIQLTKSVLESRTLLNLSWMP